MIDYFSWPRHIDLAKALEAKADEADWAGDRETADRLRAEAKRHRDLHEGGEDRGRRSKHGASSGIVNIYVRKEALLIFLNNQERGSRPATIFWRDSATRISALQWCFDACEGDWDCVRDEADRHVFVFDAMCDAVAFTMRWL